MAKITVMVVVMMTVTRFLLGFFFIGWILVWAVTPTKMYRDHWKSKITTGIQISCLGKQGSNILFYALPVLLVSVIGCFYLYAERKYGEQQYESLSVRGSRLKSIWKKPVFVKGPMGIVSLLELTLFSLFLLLLFWYFIKCLHLCFSNLHDLSKRNGKYTWENGVKNVGLCLAIAGNICIAFLFFPITRGSSILPIIGLKSESSIKYHIWVGHITLSIYLAHGLCYIVAWTAKAEFYKMLSWNHSSVVSNMAGEIALFFGLIMWLTSSNQIRRKAFEVFFYTHQLYVLFMIFFLLHVGVSVFSIVLPGFILFLLDRYLRFLQSRQEAQLVSVRFSPVGGIFELNFLKYHGVDYTPTSIVFINVPRISRYQWHPFTVVSNSNLEMEKLSVIIKKEGWWTRQLHDLLSSSLSSSTSSSIDHLEVFVEGPYGHNTSDFLRYDTMVLVSGGSGITSFISIIRELVYQSRTSNQRIPNIYLISIFKTSADLNFFSLLLPVLTFNYDNNDSDVDGGETLPSSDVSRLPLRIDAFVTRERDVTINSYRKQLQTIRFKQVIPEMLEPPLLGENGGWLSLSLIILSSFFGFLLLSFLTIKFFVDPIENFTDNKFLSYSSEAILNLLFVMVPIMLATTTVVAWNRKRLARAATHCDHHRNLTEFPFPLTTLSRMNNDTLEEFDDAESFYDDHLMEVIKVHFGKRPDLKQILLACDLPNTGVFVSGPSGLCHEVATICSSRSARNLEFECMSYNW